ncbi:uncharacterized protein EI90DRAFT_2483051 [Cantharellus anzutake]|uniref:uncharacterized protein n=1 Tax=Cantharellus anzutake TaxID=1750568 RepID=UPI001902E35B|nr:uncharacterized protein EI90DRAFT_2483051 [Cantharellus anzutake]KAF8322361.1 hypothetical protein EI90DRAFT_2483051 [Cantharellus anzutake]
MHSHRLWLQLPLWLRRIRRSLADWWESPIPTVYIPRNQGFKHFFRCHQRKLPPGALNDGGCDDRHDRGAVRAGAQRTSAGRWSVP